jgi:hypothetical protein
MCVGWCVLNIFFTYFVFVLIVTCRYHSSTVSMLASVLNARRTYVPMYVPVAPVACKASRIYIPIWDQDWFFANLYPITKTFKFTHLNMCSTKINTRKTAIVSRQDISQISIFTKNFVYNQHSWKNLVSIRQRVASF